MFGVLCVTVFAQTPGDVPITGEYPIPEDFCFYENKNCSEHDFYFQAAAQEDGCFAIHSRQANNTDLPEGTMRVAYIDVYDANGVFQRELVFTSALDFVMEYAMDTIHLYFYDHVISYDLTSGSLTANAYPAGWAMESGKKSTLQSSSFSSGQWQYRCKRAFHGYTELTRENSAEKQVLVSMPGSGFSLWNTALPALVLGIPLIVIRRNRRRKHGA